MLTTSAFTSKRTPNHRSYWKVTVLCWVSGYQTLTKLSKSLPSMILSLMDNRRVPRLVRCLHSWVWIMKWSQLIILKFCRRKMFWVRNKKAMIKQMICKPRRSRNFLKRSNSESLKQRILTNRPKYHKDMNEEIKISFIQYFGLTIYMK